MGARCTQQRIPCLARNRTFSTLHSRSQCANLKYLIVQAQCEHNIPLENFVKTIWDSPEFDPELIKAQVAWGEFKVPPDASDASETDASETSSVTEALDLDTSQKESLVE